MTTEGAQKWIAVDLGGKNIYYSHAAEQPTGICNKSTISFEKMSSAKKIQSMKPIFTIRGGKWRFGSQVLNMKGENIIFDATIVQNNDNGGHNGNNGNFGTGKWHAEFQQDCYQLAAENDAFIKIKQPQVIAAILSELQMSLMKASKIKEKEPLNAVIIVPSFAGQIHRKILKQAASIAGFSDVLLLNQSTAVALAYWHKRTEEELLNVANIEGLTNDSNQSQNAQQKNYLLGILSMGAKTTECSVFEFHPYQPPKLLKTIGYSDFGGDDFTDALLNAFMEHLGDEIKNELASGNNTLKFWKKRFWENCEAAKVHLSESEVEETFIKSPISGEKEEVHFDQKQFENICQNQFAKLEQLFGQCFGQFKGKLEYFLLAGGSSRLKINRIFIDKYIGAECQVLNTSTFVPEYLAQEGAAVKAAQMSFVRSNLQLPDYFARLCMNEWVYRSLSYTTNDGLNICVAFPNMQLPSQDAHLATIDYQPKKRTRSMEMSIQINESTHSSSANLGSIKLDENIIYCLSIDENGIVFVKECLQNWESHTTVLLNAKEFEEARHEVRGYEAMIIKAEKDREIRQKEEMAKAERERKEREEKKRKEEEERKRKLEEEKKRKLEEERKLAEEKKRKLEEERKQKMEAEIKRKLEEEKKRKLEEEMKRKLKEERELLRKKQQDEADRKTAEFIFTWPMKAKSVMLKGSWDYWTKEIPMERTATGTSFVYSMKLKPGYYEFKFFVREYPNYGHYSTCLLYEKARNESGFVNNYIFIDETMCSSNEGEIDKNEHPAKKDVKSQASSTDDENINKIGHSSQASHKEEWEYPLVRDRPQNQHQSSSSSSRRNVTTRNQYNQEKQQQQDALDEKEKNEEGKTAKKGTLERLLSFISSK